VCEAAVKLGRVVVEGEHEASALDSFVVARAHHDGAVLTLPCAGAPPVRQGRRPRATTRHQPQPVRPGRIDDRLDHRR